jgi:uncharacterized membrane protein
VLERTSVKEHTFKIVTSANSIEASEQRKMDNKRINRTFATVIAELVALVTIKGNTPAFAEEGIRSIQMLQLNLPLFLILMIGAGLIGSITFMVVVGAELVRRRRQKKVQLHSALNFLAAALDGRFHR